MSDTAPISPGRYTSGALPDNVQLGLGTILSGEHSFRRFRGKREPAIVVGAHCTMEGCHFSVGEQGRLEIGDYSYFTNAVLMCELDVRIGSYVLIGWNTAIADSDFHPIAPAERIADAIALSPLGAGRPRPPMARRAVVIEDDVWIGPYATILKGVRIGAGAFIEPGAVVTHDVPPRTRVLGNPAKVVGTV